MTRAGGLAATGFAMVLGLALSGCGSDDNGGSTTETKTIVITVSGDSITPNGEKALAEARQKIRELVDEMLEAEEPVVAKAPVERRLEAAARR